MKLFLLSFFVLCCYGHEEACNITQASELETIKHDVDVLQKKLDVIIHALEHPLSQAFNNMVCCGVCWNGRVSGCSCSCDQNNPNVVCCYGLHRTGADSIPVRSFSTESSSKTYSLNGCKCFLKYCIFLLI